MEKAKILRQCNEIERAVNELYVKRQDSITRDERIALINMLGVTVAEITAPPKSNADRIRQMTDEELAEWFAPHMMCNECERRSKSYGCDRDECMKYALIYMKQEVSEDAGTD